MITAFKFIGDLKAAKFPSQRAAIANANDWFMPANADELAAQTVLAPTSEMVKLYNQLAETPVKKFADRATAAKRLWNLVQEKVTMDVPNENDIPDNVTEKFKQATAAEAAKNDAKAAEKAEKKAAAEKLAQERAEKKAAREAAKAEKGDNTRRSRLAGHTLFHTVGKDAEGEVKNPRRSGSHGYSSLQIIIDAGDKGISVKDYVAKGGRMNDLHWDVDHGNVRTEAQADEAAE